MEDAEEAGAGGPVRRAASRAVSRLQKPYQRPASAPQIGVPPEPPQSKSYLGRLVQPMASVLQSITQRVGGLPQSYTPFVNKMSGLMVICFRCRAWVTSGVQYHLPVTMRVRDRQFSASFGCECVQPTLPGCSWCC